MIFIYAKEFSKPYHQTLIGIFPTAEDYIACKDSLECRCNDLDGYLHQEHLTDRGIYIEPGKNKNFPLNYDCMPCDVHGLGWDLQNAIFDINQIKDGANSFIRDGEELIIYCGEEPNDRKINVNYICKVLEEIDKKYNITSWYNDLHESNKNKNLDSEVMPIDLGLTESMEALENFISKYKRG